MKKASILALVVFSLSNLALFASRTPDLHSAVLLIEERHVTDFCACPCPCPFPPTVDDDEEDTEPPSDNDEKKGDTDESGEDMQKGTDNSGR